MAKTKQTVSLPLWDWMLKEPVLNLIHDAEKSRAKKAIKKWKTK